MPSQPFSASLAQNSGVHGGLGRHHLAHEVGRALAVEKLARGVAQQFLLFGEADIHVSPSNRRRNLKTALCRERRCDA